ncbi:MAG: hypothetical protein NZ480_02550 [Bdellovibrionaceae bacterium]|nr:hypothetical protein [Pseudobdellovibrionaceae bacterium]MDW8190900.1 hypothetical protein [Pseudobdellovibrionaceae bacterium]
MSYSFYKILHISGIALFFLGLGWFIILNKVQTKEVSRFWGGVFHGLGLLLLFVSGFGLAAKLGFFSQIPNWMFIKILIWIALAVSIVGFRKYPRLWLFNLLLIWALFTGALFLVTMKPI